MSTTSENATTIGQRLVEYCREARWAEAVNDLYADSVVSVEACDIPGGARVVEGIAAVRAKGQAWMENHEMHSCEVRGPFPNGDDRFALVMKIDVTHKPSGGRMAEEEVCLYEVKDGRITREEFFYQGPPQ